MATTICAWCGKILKSGSGPVSHGLCVECSEHLLSGKGLDLRRFIELLQEPVALVDDDAEVLATNSSLRELVDHSPSESVGAKVGVVFECAYSGLPGGCGRTSHCAGCVIRNSVTTTYRTGERVVDAPAVVNHLSREPTEVRVSTERAGDVVLLKLVPVVHPGRATRP